MDRTGDLKTGERAFTHLEAPASGASAVVRMMSCPPPPGTSSAKTYMVGVTVGLGFHG
jgi:hypothetical protein